MTNTKNHSRKISLLVAILILLTGVFLGGYLVLKSGQVSAGQLSDILKGTTLDATTCQPNANDANKDSDDDGLKDWQELQVYFSDACKTDTDGDGYFDGEEVSSGYDPAKKAPGDELPGTTPKTPRPLPSNLTIALKQKLSEQLTQDKISSFGADGNLLSSSELEEFPGIQQSVWEITQHKDQFFAPDPIDENQIKTTTDNSRGSIQRYAEKAAAAIPSLSENPPVEETEAALFLTAVQNNDFSELNSILSVCQTAYANLKNLNVAVPTDLLSTHKEQLNMLSSLIKIYLAIKDINTDPLKANLAIQEYEIVSLEMSNWLKNVSNIISTHP
ncbi:MAG TPA: hypothetical protein P5089_03925 [Candidatus Portnoybacteria bacterium]|nr:hypothetical protein [Candidatus Portnoybacteria bacterium]